MVIPEDPDFRPVETMALDGGDLSLDFVNTGSRPEGALVRDRLEEYADLVTWAERVGLISTERGARLRGAARRSPGEAERSLGEARALREALFRLFAEREASPEDLRLVSEAATEAWRERRLVRDEDGAFGYAWPESDRLDQLLWPVALAASELLTSDERGRVKECASETCGWLFLDLSRNRSRRWCDMKVCGNRAKARRFSARQREA